VTLDDVRTLAQVRAESDDLSLRRDQAGAALLFLSGMRVSALGSLPIAAVDIPGQAIKQWPALGIRTKNGRTATTYLLPIPELLEIVGTWDNFIRHQLPPTAMWFTPILNDWGKLTLSAGTAGSNRNVAIGRRLRILFALAGLPYKSAHKFRHGHAVWALQHAKNMADHKAISQNLMHGDIRITDGIYAPLLGDEVQQRIASLAGEPGPALGNDQSMTAYLSQLSRREMSQALQMLADAITQ
jgi:integrase